MQQATIRRYISKNIQFSYSNSENLKYSVQDFLCPNIKELFISGLNDIQGDNNYSGTHLSELTLIAMAYYFEYVHPKKYAIKDSYYTLNSVKGFLDANNLTSYTPIHEIQGTYFELNDATLYRHCWLIIQTAWFVNSPYFGHHQYLEYTNHYKTTGDKLPLSNYRFDKTYLERKYNSIDSNSETNVNPYYTVEKWYYYILVLVVNELDLPDNHFKNKYNDYREYNVLTKCPKQLRPLTPFVVSECDIKSAFPSFLDYQFGCKLKDEVYNNLMKSERITRGEAKILFNKVLNSGEYKTKQETIKFLIKCGYDESIATKITALTHDPKKKFIFHMTEFEESTINTFKKDNYLPNAGRLHDSIVFIKSEVKPKIFNVDNSGIEFNYKDLNRAILEPYFNYSNKVLPYARISSLPPTPSIENIPLIKKQIIGKPDIIGEANGFRIYSEKIPYIGADFDICERYDYNTFLDNLKQSIGTLKYLNNRSISKKELLRILNHIRQHSNIVFSVRHTFKLLLKFLHEVQDIEEKHIDFSLTESQNFKTKLDFLKALNNARKTVNQFNNLALLHNQMKQCINSGVFQYLEIRFTGKKINTVLERTFLSRWNFLTTGYSRKPRVKRNPFYKDNIKEGNSKLPKKEHNKLHYNKLKAKCLLNLLSEVIQHKSHNYSNQEKKLLATELNWLKAQKGITEAELSRLKPKFDEVKPYTPTAEDLKTDMTKSIFNQLTEEEAFYRYGETFFKEYEKFHDRNSSPE